MPLPPPPSPRVAPSYDEIVTPTEVLRRAGQAFGQDGHWFVPSPRSSGERLRQRAATNDCDARRPQVTTLR